MNRTLLTAALLALTTTAHAASPGTTLQVGIDLTASPSPLYALVSGSWVPWGVFSSGNFSPVMGGCASGYVHAAASTPGTNPVVCQAIAFSDVTGALATPLPIVNGGTGQTTASAAFNALSPLTTLGDILFYNSGNQRLAVGTNGQCLTISGGIPTWGNCAGTVSLSFPLSVTGTTSSGGVPYFSNATTLSSSAALAANALVIGGGAGVAPSTTTTGTGVLTAVAANTNAAGGIYTYGTMLPAAMFPALTGDLTTSAGSLTTTLANVNANVGTWGSATQSPSITVNGKGLITGVTLNTIAPSITNVTGLGTGVATALANATNGASGVPVLNGSGVLAVAQGGNGTATPSLTAGANVGITGSWPNYTISASLSSINFPATVTGSVSSGGIPYFSGAGTMSSSGTLAANALVIGGGAGVAPSTTTTGTGVITALGVNTNVNGGMGTVNGAITSGHCLQWSLTGIQDAGGACTTGGGGGTVTASPQFQIPFYSSAGTSNTVTGSAYVTVGGAASGDLTLGAAGSVAGSISFANATSGTVKIAPPAGALGSAVLTAPAATDTLVGRATTDTLTNKTMSTGSVWNGTVVAGQYGGTGVANTGKTITLGASLTTTGTGAPTLAFPNTTSYTYTFPGASDTIAVLGQPQTFTATQTFPNNSLTLSEIAQISTNTVLGNATNATANVAAMSMPSCSTSGSALQWTTNSGFNCNASAGTVTSVAGGAGVVISGTASVNPTVNLADFHAQGRLTLSSTLPVMTATISGATTIYYLPYNGRFITIWDGTNDTNYDIGVNGINIALGSNWAASAAFDVFAYNNSGSAALCTVAWTNVTTRATALDHATRGYYTNSGTPTCRTGNASTITLSANQGTYLGSFYTNGSTGQVDYNFGGLASGGAAGSLGIWNYYNRRLAGPAVTDSGVAYSYTTATWRAARASTTNRITFMIGVAEDNNKAEYVTHVRGVATLAQMQVGIGVDSTTAPTQNALVQSGTSNQTVAVTAVLTLSALTGQHYIQAMESGDGTYANLFDQIQTNYLTLGIWN